MPTVWIESDGERKTVQAPEGASLLSVLQKAAPERAAFPCGGNHTCGKCLVQVEGKLHGAGEAEKRLLPAGSGRRLACFVRIHGDCRVKLIRDEAHQAISKAFEAELIPGEPLYAGGYGAAVDIGTTTVVAYLFRRGAKEPAAVMGEMNAQRAYGSDVLSRIVSCDQYGVETLKGLISEQIGAMLAALCRQAGVDGRKIGGCCITGNTTMLHILAGLDPHGIGAAPFRPASLFGYTRELTFPGFGPLPCYLPPCISAYVGGDITCSLLASGLADRARTAMLIDIGTNGEIVLAHGGELYCCSTAAGPAFEGANISCGMQAQAGAIDQVWREGEALRFHVLGETAAAGICGSGLIDVVCAAKSAGLLDRKGRPADRGSGLPVGDSGVVLSRKDLSELMLAKAAVRGGIDTLLHVCAISAEEIEEVVLCGGFGSYLNVDSAVGIGLLPEAFRGRVASIGNAAGAGAGMLAQNGALCARAGEIAAMAKAVELSADPYFVKAYVRFMNFG